MFDAVWQGRHGATNKWSPRSFFATVVDEIPHFGGNQQQDAHEFLRFLLDRLDAEYHAAYQSIRSSTPPPEPMVIENNTTPGRKKRAKKMKTKKQMKQQLPVKIAPIIIEIEKEVDSATVPFAGKAMSRVRCGKCLRCTETEQPFLDISVEVPERTLYVRKHQNVPDEIDEDQEIIEASVSYECRPLSLDDCLRRFTHVEELQWKERYQCSHCIQDQLNSPIAKSSKGSTAAATSSFSKYPPTRSYEEIAAGKSPFIGLEPTTKQIEIVTPPQILVLHFKRLKMTYGRRNVGWRKIKRYVQFPLRNLNLTPYVMNKKDENGLGNGNEKGNGNNTKRKRRGSMTFSSSSSSTATRESPRNRKKKVDTPPPPEEFWYHLSSVVIHHGNGNNGHYTCCVKNKLTGFWTHRNDSRVFDVSEEYVASQEAYMLIYERGDYIDEDTNESEILL